MGLLGKWHVLEHKDGGSEVWDCGPFGPWRKLSGPHLTQQAAIDARKRLTGQDGDGGVTLLVTPRRGR